MEKKRLRKKDILRMDGLLPPTRRLPVCDAVSGASDKKKEKKWSIGGILRRISSIRDYDSSSNDEEIVYCNRTPKKLTKLNRQLDGVVLHSMEDNLKQKMTVESNVRPSTDSHRDSLHSRSSDGSLDGLGKKTRKNKLKARAKAKRDYLCVESSSDEDCRRSNNSLNRIHDADGAQNGQRSNMCNRKTRAARTERYIKRLSRDEGNGTCDSLSDSYNKKCSLERTEDKQRALYADVNGLCRPPAHPRRFGAFPNSSRALPVQRSSMETFRDPQHAGLPNPNEAFNDYRRYSTGQYVTDLNQNNAYGKISRHISGDADNRAGNFFTYPTKNACHYSESFDYVIDHRSMDPDSQPPVPPPRDPRYRVFNYGYSSYPMNRHQHVPNSFKQEDRKTNTVRDIARPDWRNLGNYGSNNELAWRDKVEVENSPNPKAEFRNSLECINNKYNCSRHRANESTYEESEAMRCRRRNTRNDQLNCIDANYGAYKAKNKSANICESNKYETISSHASVASSDWSSGRSPCNVDNHAENNQIKDNIRTTPTEEDLENRRRSSRNLEEALSELEAIYNSLRLGDEDLLDRAERRSMEEFSLKQAKNELDAGIVITPDSPDRTKDDMAYRRMHPKERPTSLSDIAGQSTLSNISYLIASPVLSRRDSANDLARLPSTYPSRRDEPDVMRDDVVFRSINHANNTLRIIDPQPPFGIPLGPVATATESDYLHTTPTKPEQPRSPYIPQCEPDVITDDLAYRALRKDAGATRNVVGENRIDVSREQPRAGLKKKRAVRSLSANLYGLINQDRIHLRREPSLDTIKDEIQNVAANNLASMTERPEYLRRVVSDGELSDIDAAHRRREPAAITGETDINGNHPAANAYRKKLCISPQPSPKKEKEPNIAKLSDAMLSSTSVLDDKFWHEYLGSDSNVSMPESSRNTETVFTTYSRLCQDLVNLIKSDDGDSTPLIESSNDSAVMPTDKPNDFDVKLGVDEPSMSVPIRSLSSHCPERNARANDEQSSTAFSVANSSRPASEPTPTASNLDFYLCAVDENVRLIAAEAFDGSTDRLRDSRLSARKNSWTSRSSEVENQSASTRSSTLYSQDDQGNDDRLVGSSRFEDAPTRVPSKRNSSTINDGDQDGSSHLESVSTADAEFSKAVRDLELAAASLCEHEREIEDLGRTGRGKKTDDDVAASITDEDAPMRKINLIADALRQERERDQEEITVVPPSGIETTRSDARDEGERTWCELDGVFPDATCVVSRVTNIITVTVTTCSMFLLACLLALLLAIVAALSRRNQSL